MYTTTDMNQEQIRSNVVLLIDGVKKLKTTAIEAPGHQDKVLVDKHTYDRVARVVEELGDVKYDIPE